MREEEYKKIRKNQNRHWWFRGKRTIVLSLWRHFCEPEQGDRVLDVGCGYGFLEKGLRDYDVCGIDLNEDAVRYCGRYFPAVKGDILNIPFSTDTFDTVFALDVFEYVAADVTAMNNVYRVLRPGGYLVCAVPADMSLWSANDEVCEHKRRYDLTELKNKIESVGFKTVKISYYNSKLYLPIKTVRKVKNLLGIKSDDLSEETRDSGMNRMLYDIFASEKDHLIHGKYKKGVSLIMIARK